MVWEEERRVLLLRQGTAMEQGGAVESRVGALEEGGRETGSACPYPNLEEKFFLLFKGTVLRDGFGF
jgi:hypothetical protein